LGDFRQPEANENKEKTAKSSLFLAVMGYFRWQWAAENILPKIRSIFNAFRIKYCHSRWVFMAAKYIIIFCGLHWLSRWKFLSSQNYPDHISPVSVALAAKNTLAAKIFSGLFSAATEKAPKLTTT
jgi:hypothetical protein